MGTHPASAAKQACQQAFHGQICIELGPMQPYALRRNFNVSQLLGPGTGQALCQLGWKRKKSAVFQTNHDAFFSAVITSRHGTQSRGLLNLPSGLGRFNLSQFAFNPIRQGGFGHASCSNEF